uniref:Polyprotein n=1 Tax=Heligmosomoides polygyrus TaxID=6339 RepID=A0A183GWL5_HELPZ
LKVIAGTSVGTDTLQCDNSQAYCYNMTANAAGLLDIMKVGCSLWRCMVSLFTLSTLSTHFALLDLNLITRHLSGDVYTPY